jgi:drug/metabolite transporter (DMT)-like permease
MDPGSGSAVADGKINVIRVYVILLIGVVIASFSSILIRWTGAVPFTIIAFYRLFISSGVLVLIKGVQRNVWPAPKASYFLAGFFLALHFITWIASLQLTSIANSIFLESTHPLWAALISFIFLKESPTKKTLPAFLSAIFGMLVIVSIDFGHGETRLWGDILAIISAICLSFYLLIARIHRHKDDIISYLIFVYASAALVCLIYGIMNADSFIGYSTMSWIMMIVLALGPHLFGHSLLNWSSRRIEIYKVNLVLLLEPILATIGGMLFFMEFPPFRFYTGAFLIVFSISYVIYTESFTKDTLMLETETGRKN